MHRSVHDEFVQALRKRVASLVLGDGLDDKTDVGPVINDKAVERIAAYAAIGRNEADLVIGGEPARDGALAKGCFFQPTIFAEVKPDARIAQEEIFGPVTSVIPVELGGGRAGRELRQVRPLDLALHARHQPRVPLASATSTPGWGT